MWPTAFGLPQIRALPYLSPTHGARGRSPWRNQELTVGDVAMMTDPVADMLTRIRNANTAMHDEVIMPSSKLKVALADMLKAEGYIGGFDVTDNADKPGQSLTIRMKYSPKRERVISGLKRVSKPGLRVYSGSKDIPRVVGGLGVAVVSTSKGLMSDREARRRRLGGEVLCYVW